MRDQMTMLASAMAYMTAPTSATTQPATFKQQPHTALQGVVLVLGVIAVRSRDGAGSHVGIAF
jgi:hypothetical protein